MTLLGNSVEMSRQEEHDPFRRNKRSKRSMRDSNQRLQQEGSGSRMASHAIHTPPREAFFSLFTCPDRISQQSHLSRPPPIDRPVRPFPSQPEKPINQPLRSIACLQTVHTPPPALQWY